MLYHVSHQGSLILEKEMATHSSILAWKNPWTEEPGGLQSMGLHDWAHMHEGGGRWVCSIKQVELKKKKEKKTPWCCESLKAGGEGDNREWDGWMASPTQWTWVWVSSRSCQWTWKPGVLQSIGLQRVGHAWATELNWTDDRSSFSFVRNLYAILHSGYFSSHSHQQYRRASFSPHPLHCLLFVDFWCWPFWLVWSDTSM